MILDHSGFFFFGPFFKNYLISLLFRDTHSQVLYRRKNGNNWRETMEFDLRSTADHHSRVFSPPLSSGHRRLCPRADVKTTTSTSETAGASTFKAWVHPPRDTHKHTHTHEPGSPSSILPQVFFPPTSEPETEIFGEQSLLAVVLCSPAARGLDRLLGPVVEKVGEKVWKQTGEKHCFLSFYQKNKLAGLFKFWS